MKKSFKNNPALQFITNTENSDVQTENIPLTKTPEPKEGYKINPLYIETKTRRLQLILKPSVYEKVKANAVANKLSVNEYIHQILENAVND